MKKVVYIIFLSLCCYVKTGMAAGMPMPDFLQNILKKVETISEQYAEIEQEVNTKVKKNIDKLTSMYEEGKDKVEQLKEFKQKVEGVAKTAEEFAKDPANAALKMTGRVIDALSQDNLQDDAEKTFVYTSDPTPEQYKQKME